MEIEKKMTIAAPREKVWAMLLDPNVMGACVPGMESIDVISDTEYLVSIHVKMSFISARFKVRTFVVETREPEYLKSEGKGEDSSLTSSLKHTSEVFLTELGPNETEFRTIVNVELLGRLGSFGMNMVKTKADRMWDDFGRKLAERITGETQPEPATMNKIPSTAEGESTSEDQTGAAGADKGSLMSRMRSVFGSSSS
ncbi:4-hydroxybenzoyl-CoA reductase [Pusillimonas sp. DMV24BSW_D]|uniref:CoxG family protein n=1 Tax=Neopusillimonas aestuarii TaxID=2716226 RepID=UPI00140BEB86|nr:SRPBCC domain-containing protein [Pusillimonas sp. DMV24BSW_D]QIM49022.1 4-hydroxybenzoyl-CoA reductase [Pusillimonas sp. DMV24BSW_D]